jgi:hypothetical protein
VLAVKSGSYRFKNVRRLESGTVMCWIYAVNGIADAFQAKVSDVTFIKGVDHVFYPQFSAFYADKFVS